MNTKIAAALRASSANRPQKVQRKNRQRAECFGVIDFGDDADVAIWQPLPRANDGHAAVIAVAVDVRRQGGRRSTSAAASVSGSSWRRAVGR